MSLKSVKATLARQSNTHMSAILDCHKLEFVTWLMKGLSISVLSFHPYKTYSESK